MAAEPTTSFARRVLAATAIAVAVAILVLLAWYAVNVLLTLFAGVLVAVLLRGLAVWLGGRTGLSSGKALAVVCVVLALAGGAVISLTAASITREFSEMLDQLPEAIAQVRAQVEANPLGRRLLTRVQEAGVEEAAEQLPVSRVVGVASGTVGALGTALLIAFVGIFLAADPGVYRRGALLLVPPARRGRVATVLDETGDTLLRWLTGRLLLMAVIGVLSWIGLMLLGVPVALALGLLAGLLSFIPNLGPVLSAIPAVLIAATVTPMLAVWVAVLYIGLQTAESYLLEPYVVRRTVSVPPAANIGFQLLMGTWLGVLGLTLATPLFAVITVVVSRFYVEDILGDRLPADEDG